MRKSGKPDLRAGVSKHRKSAFADLRTKHADLG
jgi:hypothetical protein